MQKLVALVLELLSDYVTAHLLVADDSVAPEGHSLVLDLWWWCLMSSSGGGSDL